MVMRDISIIPTTVYDTISVVKMISQITRLIGESLDKKRDAGSCRSALSGSPPLTEQPFAYGTAAWFSTRRGMARWTLTYCRPRPTVCYLLTGLSNKASAKGHPSNLVKSEGLQQIDRSTGL